MNANKYIYTVITTILLLVSFVSFGQRGLKDVYLPSGLEACVSDSFDTFELTVEWRPPMPAADNVYTIELSDAKGDFSAPLYKDEVKQKNSTPKFTIPVKLPKGLRGKGYKIRVTSSNPFSQKETKPFPAYYITVRNRLVLNNKEANVTLCPGESRVISVDDKSAVGYRWYKNDNLIPAVSGPSYTVSEAGVYQVEVDYGDGYCTRSADTKSNKVTVTVQGTTDLKLNGGITQKYICKGQSFKLVASKKDADLTYSWYKDNNPNPIVSGKGMDSYETPKGDGAVGKYYVKVGDNSSACQERSNILEVKIRGEGLEVKAKIEDGSEVILPGVEKKLIVSSTVAAGNPTYQWYKDGVKIVGATGKEYIAKLQGKYRVDVIDSAGGCDSDAKSNELNLVEPESFEGEIGYKSYYPSEGCKTNKVIIGLTKLIAVINSQRKEVIPKSGYADLVYKWEKDGVPVSGETGYDITLDNPSKNGTYVLHISRSGIASTQTKSLPVKLIDSNSNITLEASYIPSDEGGVVHLCPNFTVEKLEVKGNVPMSASYVWYKDDVKIVGATEQTYNATAVGNYRVEVYDGSSSASCPVVTNNLLLQLISIEVNFLDPFKHFTATGIPVKLYLPYKELELRTSIIGVDPDKRKINWYKKTNNLISSGNSENYKVEGPGDYYCGVTSNQGCTSEKFSKTVKVVSPRTYSLEIDYRSGKEACNDAEEVVLELVKLSGVAQVGTDEIKVEIPKEEYKYYQFQWYKDNQKLSGQTSTTLTVPAEETNGTSTISNYSLEVTYGGITVKSNSKQAGVEKLETTIVLDGSAGFSPQENEVFICKGGVVVLKADVRPNNPNNTYQWYKGLYPIPGAVSPTLSVTEEAGYYVKVSGEVCKNIDSKNTYNVKFFNKDQVKFYLNGTDEVLDLSKNLSFVAGESIQIRVEGAKSYIGLNEYGLAEGIKTNGDIITISKGGKFKVKADIGNETCAVIFDLKVEEIPLPSEIPTVVIPGSANNRYWNLPSKYMQKENVKVSIYTQDGVEVLSTTNFQNDSWPKDFNVESTGRAVIYLYIVEVDGAVEERGTITLFQ